MKVAILTWNDRSKYLYELFSSSELYQVVAVLETDYHLWGDNVGKNHMVSSAGKVMNQYEKRAFEKFVLPSMDGGTDDVYRDLMEFYHVAEEDFLYAPNDIFCNPLLSEEEKLSRICLYRDNRELDSLEVHVADHCNLRCKNCTMMANLVEHPVFPDFEETMEGVRKARTFFDHVKIFRILGGEPLLNPELEKYIDSIREIYPYTDLRLVTNGCLIPAASRSLFECLRRNRVNLYISYYKISADYMEEVHAILNQWEISHYITKTVTSFQKVYNLAGDTDRDFSFESCIWRKHGCETLKGHEISVCFVPTVIHYLREHFHLDIPDDGRLDLFQPGLTTQEIRDFLSHPFETCRFCALRGHFEKWELLDRVTREELSSWSI